MITNVTATTVDHACPTCGHSSPGIPLAQVIKNQEPSGVIVLSIVGGCEAHTGACGRPTGECGRLTTGCTVHTECFNPRLTSADEVPPPAPVAPVVPDTSGQTAEVQQAMQAQYQVSLARFRLAMAQYQKALATAALNQQIRLLYQVSGLPVLS